VAINFHEFLLLEEEFSKQDLLGLAKRIFGGCRYLGNITCTFGNRYVAFSYYPHKSLINVSFNFLEQPEHRSLTEPTGFATARELQPGTMTAIRKFEEFARELKKRGIGITYITGGRRLGLYKRVLEKAGMSVASSSGGFPVWR